MAEEAAWAAITAQLRRQGARIETDRAPDGKDKTLLVAIDNTTITVILGKRRLVAPRGSTKISMLAATIAEHLPSSYGTLVLRGLNPFTTPLNNVLRLRVELRIPDNLHVIFPNLQELEVGYVSDCRELAKLPPNLTLTIGMMLDPKHYDQLRRLRMRRLVITNTLPGLENDVASVVYARA
jgi:hypothetical protein